MRGCGLRGRPVGSRKRRLFPVAVPWKPAWVPVWMTGVDGRGVVSSSGGTNKGAEMSGRVCPDDGPCEEPGGPLPEWEMSRRRAHHDRVKSPSSNCCYHEGVGLGLPRVQTPRNVSDNVGASIKGGSLLPLLCLAGGEEGTQRSFVLYACR